MKETIHIDYYQLKLNVDFWGFGNYVLHNDKIDFKTIDKLGFDEQKVKDAILLLKELEIRINKIDE